MYAINEMLIQIIESDILMFLSLLILYVLLLHFLS